MFLGRISLFLCGEHVESLDHAETGVARFDDIIDIAVFRRIVGISEELTIFFLFLFDKFCRIFVSLCLFGIKHAYRTFGTHYCDFL